MAHPSGALSEAKEAEMELLYFQGLFGFVYVFRNCWEQVPARP
jgi:hypothetical protein